MRLAGLAIIFAGLFAATPAAAQDDAQDLAKQLANPIASLISVPFQLNYDDGFGPDDDGHRITLNIQPVVPISLGENWNLISRTILPIISQDGVASPGSDQFGLGDVVQSAFLSPKEVGDSGIVWGVGPVFLLPTATSDYTGTGKWGVGPTAVALKQSGSLTIGLLANQIWSVAGDDARGNVSQALVQPFVSYATAGGTTYGISSETTYDWINDQATIPLILSISQLTKFGKQPVQIGGGGKIFLESPANGPDWGLRFNLVLLFPTG